jgi:hypothetical protein
VRSLHSPLSTRQTPTNYSGRWHFIVMSGLGWTGGDVIQITANLSSNVHSESGGSVYTVHMGKTGALMLLAVLALWAAVPALACLFSPQGDDCCRQMMQKTGACNMDARQSCCQMHGTNSSSPICRATAPERPGTLVSANSGTALRLPVIGGILSQPPSATVGPIPRHSSSVLRI